MREHTKWIMILTALAFVGLMVFQWGMDLSGRSSAGATGGEIGEINGEPVTYDQFLTVYRNLYEQEQRNREDPITGAENKAIEDAAWEQLVMDKLIQQELDRRGIRTTDTEVRQAARYAPPPEFYSNELFQTDGRFDLNKYHQFLSSNAIDQQLLMQLESYYRDMIPRSKLYNQVTSGLYVSDGELWRMWRETTETVRVRYIPIDPSQVVPDASVTVEDSDIRKYYDEHKSDFDRPARANVRLVTLDKTPTAADTAATRSRAMQLRQEILGGTDFAEVAERESKDPASAQQGGNLGESKRGQFVPAFDQAVWSLPVGEISQPIETQFGIHLIQVQKRTEESADVRHILLPIQLAPENDDRLLELADSLESLGEKGSLESAAKQLGLTVRSIDIDPENPFVPGLGQLDEGSDWAFEDAEVGEASPVFELPTAYYMLELVRRTPARTLTLEEAKATIRAQLMAERKLEKARQVGREMVDALRAGQSLEQVAAAKQLAIAQAGPFTRTDFVPELGGRTNAAIGTAFGLKTGQVSGLVEASGKLFILQVLERKEANRSEFDQVKQLQRGRILTGLEQERWQQFLASLRENAKVVDNRAKVLRPASEADQNLPPVTVPF